MPLFSCRPQVTISTCGSAYDTKLILATDLQSLDTYVCNDDDRACAFSTSNSRIDATLKARRVGAGGGSSGAAARQWGRVCAWLACKACVCTVAACVRWCLAPACCHTVCASRRYQAFLPHPNPWTLVQANVVHYLVVDGYYHSSGAYSLTITCDSCPGGLANFTVPAAGTGGEQPAGGSSGAWGGSGSSGGWDSSVAGGSPLAAAASETLTATNSSGSSADGAGGSAAPRRKLAGHPAADGCGRGVIPEDAASPSLACSAGLTAAGELALSSSMGGGSGAANLVAGGPGGAVARGSNSGLGSSVERFPTLEQIMAMQGAASDAERPLPASDAGDGGRAVALMSPGASAGDGGAGSSRGTGLSVSTDGGGNAGFGITDWDSQGPGLGTSSGLGRAGGSFGASRQPSAGGGGAGAASDGAQHGVSTPFTFAIDAELEALKAAGKSPSSLTASSGAPGGGPGPDLEEAGEAGGHAAGNAAGNAGTDGGAGGGARGSAGGSRSTAGEAPGRGAAGAAQGNTRPPVLPGSLQGAAEHIAGARRAAAFPATAAAGHFSTSQPAGAHAPGAAGPMTSLMPTAGVSGSKQIPPLDFLPMNNLQPPNTPGLLPRLDTLAAPIPGNRQAADSGAPATSARRRWYDDTLCGLVPALC